MRKIIPADKVLQLSKRIRALNKKIVLVGGCFDILHLGHIRFIKNAKKLGDVLIILLENDGKIKKMKGEERPINSQKVRSEVLSALQDVDFIILLPETMQDKNYDDLVKKIKPDFIAVTKGDPGIEYKKRSAKLVGAEVRIVINRLKNYSTGKLLGCKDKITLRVS